MKKLLLLSTSILLLSACRNNTDTRNDKTIEETTEIINSNENLNDGETEAPQDDKNILVNNENNENNEAENQENNRGDSKLTKEEAEDAMEAIGVRK